MSYLDNAHTSEELMRDLSCDAINSTSTKESHSELNKDKTQLVSMGYSL